MKKGYSLKNFGQKYGRPSFDIKVTEGDFTKYKDVSDFTNSINEREENFIKKSALISIQGEIEKTNSDVINCLCKDLGEKYNSQIDIDIQIRYSNEKDNIQEWITKKILENKNISFNVIIRYEYPKNDEFLRLINETKFSSFNFIVKDSTVIKSEVNNFLYNNKIKRVKTIIYKDFESEEDTNKFRKICLGLGFRFINNKTQ